MQCLEHGYTVNVAKKLLALLENDCLCIYSNCTFHSHIATNSNIRQGLLPSDVNSPEPRGDTPGDEHVVDLVDDAIGGLDVRGDDLAVVGVYAVVWEEILGQSTDHLQVVLTVQFSS